MVKPPQTALQAIARTIEESQRSMDMLGGHSILSKHVSAITQNQKLIEGALDVGAISRAMRDIDTLSHLGPPSHGGIAAALKYQTAIADVFREKPYDPYLAAIRSVNSGGETPRAKAQTTQDQTLKSIADLGPLIRKSRKAMKFSQQQFADAAGVGRRFLSELENGKPSLEFDKVIACALAAGIDILAKPRRPL